VIASWKVREMVQLVRIYEVKGCSRASISPWALPAIRRSLSLSRLPNSYSDSKPISRRGLRVTGVSCTETSAS
jgi:hypothetical protein